MERWRLPVGTLIEACTASVIYPDGTVEKWEEVEARQRRKPPAPDHVNEGFK
jgi:hypothetical protein